MSGVPPIGPTNNSQQNFSLDNLNKQDKSSIFAHFDADKSGAVSDKEIVQAGVPKDMFDNVKKTLTNFFGKEKLSNLLPNGYAEYNELYTPPTKIVHNIEDIPLGSHDNVRMARYCDIRNLKLKEEDLLNLIIDKTTIMSQEQQEIISEYMEKAKNPGLGIRNLHAQGITGKGVKIAIIDQPLGKHKEYSNNIKAIHNINMEEFASRWDYDKASMHGAAVASIAVGKSVGVAPDAELEYYSAINCTTNSNDIENYKKENIPKLKDEQTSDDQKIDIMNNVKTAEQFGFISSNKPYVDAINQILDNNEKSSENEKVSVISISWGFNKSAPGYEELQKAVARAKEQGVFIVSTALSEQYGFLFNGANRNPKGDLENSDNYEAGAFFKKFSEVPIPTEYRQNMIEEKNKTLLVPMDHRTVADYTDSSSYRYDGNDGGMSWATPWLAGMYVLAKQVDSSITPEKFWEYALETSNECHNNDTGTYVGRLINPEKLIETIKNNLPN
jgi:hypothetical protein